MKTLLTVAVIFASLAVIAQPERTSVVIGSMTSRPNALLIVNPQNSDQGVLLPQLSTGQRLSLKPASPAEDGLIVFDKNLNEYFYWSGGQWTKFRHEAIRPRYHSIDPANFQELKPDFNIRHNNMVIFESDNTFVTASRNGLGEEIVAPVNLPHEALLTELTVFYMDNDDDNIKMHLVRKNLLGVSEHLMSWESSGASPVVTNTSFTNFNGREKIDLENYTYRLIVVFDIDDGEEIDFPGEAKQRLYGVRIKYQE
jgi:hypothetical protein